MLLATQVRVKAALHPLMLVDLVPESQSAAFMVSGELKLEPLRFKGFKGFSAFRGLGLEMARDSRVRILVALQHMKECRSSLS